jgi:hypothetical protein
LEGLGAASDSSSPRWDAWSTNLDGLSTGFAGREPSEAAADVLAASPSDVAASEEHAGTPLVRSFVVAPTPGEAPPRSASVLPTACADANACADPPGAKLTPALARATVAAALRVQGNALQLHRLDALASRSRISAGLPEVRLGAGSSRDESLKLSPTQTDPARFTRDGGRDLWFEARLIWRLDGTLFSKEEIAVERLRAQEREDRARITREVLAALLEWQQARFALLSERLLPEERDAAWLRELGALARLDVLSDGWFSRQLPGPSPAP